MAGTAHALYTSVLLGFRIRSARQGIFTKVRRLLQSLAANMVQVWDLKQGLTPQPKLFIATLYSDWLPSLGRKNLSVSQALSTPFLQCPQGSLEDNKAIRVIYSISRRNNIKFLGLNPGKSHTIPYGKFTRKITIEIGLFLCKCRGRFAWKPAFTFINTKGVFTCPSARVSHGKSSGFWDLQLTQDNPMKPLM